MPKVTKYPRLRTLVRKGARGQVWVYYSYDMRPEGKPDIKLGKDHATALKKWDELHNKKPARVGLIQQGIEHWREHVLIGTKDSPSPYTNPETRRDYTRWLKRIEEWCGRAAWHDITLRALKAYLRKRKGKTQANRELSTFQIVWNHSRGEGFTDLHWPAAGMEKSGWKNPENAREREVSDEMFDAVHLQGDQILRDAMDIASATSMRITDVRTIPLPRGDQLQLKASKTGKKTDFAISLSQVLPDVIHRRHANKKALHLKLLAAPSGREVSYRMLADRFSHAREAAALKASKDGQAELAEAIRGLILRDCRKYAADKAASAEEAQKLLQHGSMATTLRHYRTKADQAKPVR
jgi:hypothetical protein